MTVKYAYVISGSGSGDTTWETKGEVTCEEFHDVFETAMRRTFMQLTQGKAVYGSPGLACRGPYKIKRLVLEEIVQ